MSNEQIKDVGLNISMNPLPGDPQSWINTLWSALDHARELYTDDQWDEICMAMACWTESEGCTDPEREEGDK